MSRLCGGVLLGLVLFLLSGPEIRSQAHRIDAPTPGLLEVGTPLFTIRSQDALGLDSAPTDMRLMPDGRVLVFSGRQIAIGDGTRWDVYRQAADDLPIIGNGIAVDGEGKLYVGVPGDYARIDLSGIAEWQGHRMNVWPAQKRSAIPISLQTIEADGEWFWHSGSGPLVQWRPGQTPRIIGHADTAEHVFRFNGSFYLSDRTSGQLWRLTDSEMELIHYSDAITPHQTITCSTPFGEKTMLVGTYADGLKLFDGQTLKPFNTHSLPTEAARINSLCRTEGGYYAMAVDNMGILFFDKEGTVVQALDRSIDSRLARVRRLIPAGGGIIWGLLDEGIIRVEFPSRFSHFEKLIGLGLATAHVYRFEGKLWLMVDGRILRGIYNPQGRLTGFEIDSPPNCFAYTFSCAMGMPVTGSERGGFYRDASGWHSFASNTVNLCILNPMPIEGRWLYAAKGEIGWLKPAQGGFEVESHPFPQLDNVYNTEVDTHGSVWLELGNANIGRVKIADGKPQLETFSRADGLLDGWAQVFSVGGKIGFNFSNQNVLHFNEAKHRFELDSAFMGRLAGLPGIMGRPALDAQGRFWITADGAVQIFNNKDGVLKNAGEKTIPGFLPYFFTFEPSGVVWMHLERRLVRYDPSMPATPERPLQALVSSISFPSSGHNLQPGDPRLLALPYSDNSLVVHYVATGGALSVPVTFNVMLEGGGAKGWDSAGNAGSTTFNRLKEGSYVLHVRPESAGITGIETTLPFAILPPWYRTNWAYAFYFATIVGFIFTVVKVASFLQRREKYHLERLVSQRTSELKETNAFLATQVDEVRRLSQAVEQSPVGVLLAKPDGSITYANPRYCSMCGFSQVELNGRQLDDLRAESVPAAVREEIASTLKAGDSWHGNLANQHKNGRVIQTRTTLSPIRGPDGSVRSLLVLEEDITEWIADQDRQRRLEAQLFQARKMKSLGTLAGGIAHDFNNILTGILGYCELASYTPSLHPEVKDALREIRNGGLRARDLVAQILTFSRKSYVKLEPLDLSTIVAEALKLIRATSPATVELISKLEPGIIRANHTQIHQVLVNLCTNAVQAMEGKPGRLEVTVHHIFVEKDLFAELHTLQTGNYMQLTVSDTGHGMDQATLDRVFDPFFTTKKHGEGTGLGLAIVQGIVSSHNGELRVRSTVGAGTTFDLYFPVCSDPLPAPIEDKKVPLGKMQEILIVDDEPSIGAVVSTRLKQLHYKPTVFQDPLKAFEAFQSSPSRFKAIITDLTMPNMTGVDLVYAIRKQADSIPVVVMTGYSQDAVRAQVDALPRCSVMQKPINCDDLARILAELLKSA